MSHSILLAFLFLFFPTETLAENERLFMTGPVGGGGEGGKKKRRRKGRREKRKKKEEKGLRALT